MIQTVLFFIASLVVAMAAMLAIRKIGGDEGPHWAVVLLLLVVAGNVAWFGDAWMKARAVRATTERILAGMDEDPVFGAMKSSDPSLYQQVVKGVRDSEEAPDAERFDRFKALTGPMVREFTVRKVSNMSDGEAVRYGSMIGDAVISVGRSDPTSCMTTMTSAAKDTARMSAIVGKDRMSSLMHDILLDPSQSTPPAMSLPEAQLLLMASLPMSAQQLGIRIVPGVKPPEGDLCLMFGTSMKAMMSSLPAATSGSFVRALVRSRT